MDVHSIAGGFYKKKCLEIQAIVFKKKKIIKKLDQNKIPVFSNYKNPKPAYHEKVLIVLTMFWIHTHINHGIVCLYTSPSAIVLLEPNATEEYIYVIF